MKNDKLCNNVLSIEFFQKHPPKQLFLMLNWVVIITFLSCLRVSANSYSQGANVDINIQNMEIKQAFNLLQQKGKIRLVYSDEDIKLCKGVSLNVKNTPALTALDMLLKDTHLNYKLLNNDLVIISVRPSKAVEIVVKGLITDDKGVPLPGVSVKLKGSAIGTSSSTQGIYTIKVPDDGFLIFSYVGYITKEVSVNNQTTINVKLAEDAKGLDEVVVTALGIKREAKSLGYAATTVDTKQLTDARTTNVGNSLVGKVAGLNVSTPPSGPGGSSKIRIRGQSSFGGDNSPLIVVNGVPINNDAGGAANGNKENFAGEGNSDTGDGLQSVNPDDIESMTVLKGAAAAALYGFRAKDGAIIITTKSGKGQQGIGVEFNSNFQADQALDYTDFQYIYGQGENGIRNASLADARRTGVWSFGPKFDNQLMWQVDGTEKPYAPFKDRVKSFYDTGILSTNSVALSGSNDNGNFRISFANTEANSIIPNTKYKKKLLNLGLNYNLSKKLSTQVNLNYSHEDNLNPPVVAQQDYNINQTIYTLANSIDPQWLESAYKDPDTGNEIYPSRFTNRTNPYWTINERTEQRKRDRLFGNVSLRYQLAPWLYAQGRAGQDYFSVIHHVNRPTGTAFLNTAASGFNGNFYQDAETFREVNLDFLVGATKKYGSFGIDATVGGNSMDQRGETLSTSVTNFYIRDLYTIGNGQIKEPNYRFYRKKVNSVYATVDFSYKDYLFLNLTGRNDWFSTLNPQSNSYLYPSVSTSFVFTEAFKEKLPAWIGYGKLRGAYAEVGGDTDPYTNALFYELNNNPFNGVALGNISGTVSPNPNLKPLKVKEIEVGLELGLFDRRVNLDIAAYRKNTVDEILDVDISNTSGFGQTKVNVGKLRNQGIEALLSVVIVRSQKFRWESAFNLTYNQSEVLQLVGEQQRIDVGTGEYIGIVSQEVGMAMGSLRGVDYMRDETGRIITANGRILAGNIITYGSAVPKYTGGWLNTISFKGFRLFNQIDFKGGHKLISNSNFNFLREGLHQGSLFGREGGVIFDAVNADGTPNTTAVEAESFYSDYRGKSIATPFVYNAGFIRWRTVSLGYDLSRLVSNTFIKGLNLSGFVNNVLILRKHVDNLDPETQYSASDLLSGLESHSMPTTRSYGLNLNVKF